MDQSRVAVITFSTAVTINFDLDDHLSNTDVRAAIDTIDYPARATRTSLGLNAARTSIFNSVSSGMRPDTSSVPR